MTKFIKIFIVSSSECLNLAEAVALNLQNFNVFIWNLYVFKPGETAIESLTKIISESDFSLILLTPDDEIKSRNLTQFGPRDNVLIEYGLSVGILGSKRTFYLYEKDSNVKIPTDILGLNGVQLPKMFSDDPLEVANSLRPICKNLETTINEIGVRTKSIKTIYDYKAYVKLYYHKNNFTKEQAENIAMELKKSNIDFLLKKHEFDAIPDTVFIGSCVPAHYARTVLNLVPYTIKYIYRIDYPELEGGDENGFKIGIGYCSEYNKKDTEARYLPVEISNEDLSILKDEKLSNTEFHIFLFKITMGLK